MPATLQLSKTPHCVRLLVQHCFAHTSTQIIRPHAVLPRAVSLTQLAITVALLAAGRTLQDDYKYYEYPTMSETLALLKARNIKFVGICQPGCDEYQMQYLVSAFVFLHSQ